MYQLKVIENDWVVKYNVEPKHIGVFTSLDVMLNILNMKPKPVITINPYYQLLDVYVPLAMNSRAHPTRLLELAELRFTDYQKLAAIYPNIFLIKAPSEAGEILIRTGRSYISVDPIDRTMNWVGPTAEHLGHDPDSNSSAVMTIVEEAELARNRTAVDSKLAGAIPIHQDLLAKKVLPHRMLKLSELFGTTSA